MLRKKFQVSVRILPALKKSVSSTDRRIIRPRMASQMFKRFISYVGKVKLTDLPEIWQKPVNEVLTAAENTVRFIYWVVLSLRI